MGIRAAKTQIIRGRVVTTDASVQVPEPIQDPGSFRDRSNRVYDDGRRIYRGIDAQALSNWRAVRNHAFFRTLQSKGRIVNTREWDESSDGPEAGTWAAHLVHERVPFVTYPYEWSFGMLKDAALLHLEILERAIPADWTLKDASAFNVQWHGARAIFIDVPSFEPYTKGEAWVGYRQFCMMFLYPLMFRAYKGIDYLPFLRGSLEGIEPATANQVLTGFSRFRRGVLSHVYLHAKMQEKYANKDLDEAKSLTEESNQQGPAKQRKFKHTEAMVLGTIQGLRRLVEGLHIPDSRTNWGDYDSEHSYAETSFEIKQQFVTKHVHAKKRRMAWDLGCNTGHFSKICAENSDYVISVDGDDKAIERLYQEQKKRGADSILPLVINLANISPNQGWRGRERKALDERGKPELILCLALIHHIVITANIPLEEFLGWLRELGADVIIELVGLSDDMTKMLLRNRVNQYEELSEPNFERIVSELFVIKDTQTLKGDDRKLYFLEPK